MDYAVFGIAWDREFWRKEVLGDVRLKCFDCGREVPCTVEDHRSWWLCDQCMERHEEVCC